MDIIDLSREDVERIIANYYSDILNKDILIKEIITVEDGKTNIQIYLVEDDIWTLLTSDEIKNVLSNYANKNNYDLDSFVFYAVVDRNNINSVPSFEGIRLNVKKRGMKRVLSGNEKAD